MIACDHCHRGAVRNYQRIWEVFDVSGDGDYSNERLVYYLEESSIDSNRHLCDEHEEAFLAGDL